VPNANNSRVYKYLWESTYFATIFLERHRVRMLRQFWQFRFGCGSAALRCIAGCQPAGRSPFQRLAD